MDIQSIQTITTAAALLVGMAYVLGGLIVNIYLSQYGVSEYQVVRVKYLVVGLVFLFYVLIMFTLSIVLFVAIILLFSLKIIFELVGITITVSLLASVGLLVLWLFARRFEQRQRSLTIAQYLSLVLTPISFLFPIGIVVRRALYFQNDLYSSALVAVAVLILVLSIFGIIYSYAYFVYGNPEFSKLDMIGVGTPVTVQLAGPSDNLSLLGQMGIPLSQPTLTDKLALIDETDKHYILGIGSKLEMRVFKIDKELVKGIVYLN